MLYPYPPRVPFPSLMPPGAPCGLPIGSLAAFAGEITGQSADATDCYVTDVESHGWMHCDGRQLLRAQYPDLFNAIGYRYLLQDEQPGTLFRIPDLRGYFLRGVDPTGA